MIPPLFFLQNFMLRKHPDGTTSVVLIDFGSTLAIDPLTLTSEIDANAGNGRVQ